MEESNAGGITAMNGNINKCYNLGNVGLNANCSVGGICRMNGVITNSQNSGDVQGKNPDINSKILGNNGNESANNSNAYLLKQTNANPGNAVCKQVNELECMRVNSWIVYLLNQYVQQNNSYPSNPHLKSWTLKNNEFALVPES